MMEILFLSPETGVTSQAKERKHEPSLARSHAARVSQNRTKKRPSPKEKAASGQVIIPAKGDQGDRAHQALDLDQATKPMSLLPSLRSGNSDPFSCQVVQITPQINELIHFYRLFYGNSAYQHQLARVKFRSNFIERTIDLMLQAPCSAQAFLHSFITLRSVVSPEDADLQREKERIGNDVSLALQTKTTNEGWGSDEVLMALKFSFIAAAFDGNIIDATMFGTLLKGLMVRKWQAKPESVDLYDFISVTYVDGQLALKHLTRTVFDVDFIDQVLEPIVAPAEKLIAPILPMINADLDEALDDLPLRSLVSRARTGRYLLANEPQNTADAASVDLWLGAESGTVQARAANYYHLVQRQLSSPELSPGERFVWLTRGAVALCLGIVFNTPKSMSLYRMNAPSGDKMASRLREIVSEIPTAASYLPDKVTSNYDGVHLWVYFVCAQDEQRKLQEQSHLPQHHCVPTAFFTRIFAAQACRMFLFQWAQVLTAIQRVVYYDSHYPNGAYWVEEAINHFAGEKTVREGLPWREKSRSKNTTPEFQSPAELTYSLPSRPYKGTP